MNHGSPPQSISLKQFLFHIKTRLLQPGLFRAHREAEARLQRPDLPAYNFRMRQEMVAHALQHSPFYRERYKGMRIPQTEAEFQQLPVVSREEVRTNFEQIRSGNVRDKDVKKLTTSGTTGPALTVLQDKRVPITPLQWRLMAWWGIKPWENQAFVYRNPQPALKRSLNHLLWWPTRRVFLESPKASPKEMEQFIVKCKQIRPILLQGYVDLVYELALYIKDKNILFPEPKAVWVTAGPLTPQQRIIMETSFGAPVFDQYGGTECFYIAAECISQNGLHVQEDVVFIEVLGMDNQPISPGNWGKIVITDLHNKAFPLIRYEIGDFGRLLPDSCSCPLGFKRIDAVKGRQSDAIRTPSGKILFADYLSALFDDHPQLVRSYQLEQKKDYSIELRYVPMNGKPMSTLISSVIGKLKADLEEEMHIEVREVKAITPINGKVPLVLSELNINYETL